MKKSGLYLLLALVTVSAFAGPGKPRKFTSAQLNHVTRLVRQTEPAPSGKAGKPGNYGDALNFDSREYHDFLTGRVSYPFNSNRQW
jgi:hypothetical protein